MAANDLWPVPTLLLRVSFVLGVIGSVASLALHIAALDGLQLSFGLVFLFQAAVIAVAAPVLIALMQRAEAELGKPTSLDLSYPFRLNLWMLRVLSPVEQIVFGVLLLYTLFQFTMGFVQVGRTAPEGFDLPMISALWLYFLAFSAIYGWRLLRLGTSTDPPRRG